MLIRTKPKQILARSASRTKSERRSIVLEAAGWAGGGSAFPPAKCRPPVLPLRSVLLSLYLFVLRL